MAEPKKLSDILKQFFGKEMSDEIFGDFARETSPEEFMKGQPFTKTEEEGFDEKTGERYTKTTYVSKDGQRKFTRKTINTTTTFSKGNADMNKSNRLYTLEMELDIAIAKEEFEKAAKIRDEIAKIKSQLKKKA